MQVASLCGWLFGHERKYAKGHVTHHWLDEIPSS